jgi:voltage-gated potassium channel
LAAIIPYFISLGIQSSDKQLNANANAVNTNVRVARVLRLFRALKLYFIFKEPKSMHAFKSIMKASLVDLAIMVIILTLFASLFGSATFYAEYQANSMFDSIPIGIYWGIMTITTVG